MSTTRLGGEKPFTPKIRASVMRRMERNLAYQRHHRFDRRAKTIAAALDALRAVKTQRDLERCWLKHFSHVNSPLPREVVFDDRETCSYCGCRAHGGVGFPKDGKDIFACYRNKCSRLGKRDMDRAGRAESHAWKKHAKAKCICVGCGTRKRFVFRPRKNWHPNFRTCRVCDKRLPLAYFWDVSGWKLRWSEEKR